MPTIVTILGCMLIGQFTADQPQAVAAIEPVEQATSAEDSRSSAEELVPATRSENSLGDPTTAADPSEPLTSPTSPVATGESTSRMTEPPAAEQPTSLRVRPPHLIAEAVTLPPGSAIAGQPLPLVQALSVSADRRQQLIITHAYWQTVETIAKYRYCLEHIDRLGRLQSRPSEEISLQAASCAATAMLREAELAAGSAQYELAGLVQYPADAPLPLPADRPHVGAYRTNFQELFAARPAPDRARIIDRTLPIRRMAIDQRAIAVQAAQDALSAAIDSYQAGQSGLASVISRNDQLIVQQRAFIESVCRYNHDIAEYAMIVAAPGAMPRVLVGYMIKTALEPGRSSITETEGDVRPAALQEPVSSSATWNGNNQSPPALRSVPGASAIPTVPPTSQWGPSVSPKKNEPTLAPPSGAATLMEKNEPTLAPPRGLAPVGTKNEPTLAPPRLDSKPKADNQSAPLPTEGEEPAKIRYSVGDPFMRRVQKVNKPVVELAAASNPSISTNRPQRANDSSLESAASVSADVKISTALYPALVDASPSVRAKQLAMALHWDRALPEDSAGKSITLEECLARQSGAAGQARHQSEIGHGARREMIEAFWIARQRAAEYQAVAQEIEFLDDLTPMVLERRAKQDGAAAMLFLHAARQDAKANLHEAHALLIEAQFELALRTQSAAESLWPMPATVPHAGQYLLNLEAQPRALVESWPMRRLAAAIPAYSVNMQEHAAAVVAADAARAKTIEKYAADELPIEPVIEDVVRQTQQTFDFLQALSDYNRSIAQYALIVLPPNAPPTRIASALVVQR